MYSGLIWFTAALLPNPFAIWRAAAWLALLVVLYMKTFREERALRNRFPDYEDYCQRVGRLVPKLLKK